MSDLWRIKCPLDVLHQRAFLMQQIRQFFLSRKVLEVHSPILSSFANTDPQLESFSSQGLLGDSSESFLRTSPEFFHKRLLAAGCGDIFEIGKVFRRAESSPIHNPEFTMLEWYRLAFTMQDLMEEVAELMQFLSAAFKLESLKIEYKSYQDIYKQYLKIDPWVIKLGELTELCTGYGYAGSSLSYDQALDFLFAIVIQPQLPQDEGLFIYHFPASQAALSQINSQDERLSLRFEFLWKNRELANGYQELTCAQEQAKRFDADNDSRKKSQQQILPVDQNLLDAMDHGLPACSGVAIGVDRLLMNLIGSNKLSDVLCFDAFNS